MILKKASGLKLMVSAKSKSGITSNAIVRPQKAKETILSVTFVALLPTSGVPQLQNSSLARDSLFKTFSNEKAHHPRRPAQRSGSPARQEVSQRQGQDSRHAIRLYAARIVGQARPAARNAIAREVHRKQALSFVRKTIQTL